MNFKVYVLVFALFLFFTTFGNANADDNEKKITLDSMDERATSLNDLNPLNSNSENFDEKSRQTIISGYAVASFTHNDRGVAHGQGNELHFGQESAQNDDFRFNLMELGFTKRYSDHAWIAAAIEAGLHTEDGATKTEVELDAGEIHLIAPVGNGVDFTFGKFNSPVSFEQEDAPLLLQASHSLTFQFASPAKMTGLMVTYPIKENLDVRAIVFNGWNQDADNNEAKSFGFQVGWAPVRWLDAKFSYLAGPEQSDNDKDFRHVFDVAATLTPRKNLLIGLEGAYGVDENGAVSGVGDAEWLSGQVTVHYDFFRWFGSTFRYSIFEDKDGHPNIEPNQPRTMHEITLAQVFHLSPQLYGYLGYGVIPKSQHQLFGIDLRLEYRHDWIDEDSANAFFVDSVGDRKSTRNMFIAELVANF